MGVEFFPLASKRERERETTGSSGVAQDSVPTTQEGLLASVYSYRYTMQQL